MTVAQTPIRKSTDSVVGSGFDVASHIRRRDRRKQIANRAVSVLAVVGGLTAVWGWIAPQSAPPASRLDSTLPTAQLVGSFATDYAETYLSAKTGGAAKLAPYIDAQSVTFPSVAATVAEARVVSIKQLTSQLHLQTWTSIVSLRIDGATNPTNERSFYRIPVSVVDGAPRAMSLPQRIEAPPVGMDVQLSYPVTVDPGSDLYVLANGFFSAYLTGREDLTRYTAADSRVAAINPTPYSSITLTCVQADKPVAGAGSLHLFVTVEARTRTYASTQLQYPISAVNSGGRWQVQALDEQPLITPNLSAPVAADTTRAGISAASTTSAIPATR